MEKATGMTAAKVTAVEMAAGKTAPAAKATRAVELVVVAVARVGRAVRGGDYKQLH